MRDGGDEREREHVCVVRYLGLRGFWLLDIWLKKIRGTIPACNNKLHFIKVLSRL